MTLASAPWALDGARITSSLARSASDAALGGAEGVVRSGDLKVSQLAVAGNGLLVSAGGAIIANRYQSTPTENYVISNVGTHTIDASVMPASNPAPKQYLVCVTIGDPEFSQVGHPWMLGTDPPVGTEETFQYVRPFLVECPSGTTSFEALGYDYPAYALARVAIPASTTTITDAMITDLRALVQPRRETLILTQIQAAQHTLTGAPAVQDWPNSFTWSIDIPKWATKMKVMGTLNALTSLLAAAGNLYINVTNVGTTPATPWDEPAPSGASDRKSYGVGGTLTIPSAYAGTTQTLKFRANANSVNSALRADVYASTQVLVLFEENVI